MQSHSHAQKDVLIELLVFRQYLTFKLKPFFNEKNMKHAFISQSEV